ncbi:hypothetical protein PHLGIDRAFT_113994 [Phlebiopsis gigantea 11061_1 CR5-6]|uniref:WW domain-containing protein n=1 Tax=Phlebiopsis gigantea (strain 11061_1 CR5-6) TaxID=745531 RepID=A0A0C3S6M9_PHLG1|nr:hypothetical protein PHLGIDRAFT_113994 [Phlebiopsis gigantea 11061_1 CR5-6]
MDTTVQVRALQEKDQSPPAYESRSRQATIYPITAVNSIRYGQPATANSAEFDIPAAAIIDVIPPAFPALHSGWIEHMHPEGARYYVNCTLAIPVVTDSCLKGEDILCIITEGLLVFQDLAAKSPKLPPTTELYIRVENETERECGYYLVDHATQLEFWLEKVTTTQIGLDQVSSEAHFRFALQEHYWTHLEYFPYRPVSFELRNELKGIIRHGQADHMTSRSSTFPYSIPECKGFLKLLDVNDVEAESPYHTCVVARIWSTIAKHRYDNLYGETCARLDRGQRVREPLVNFNNIFLQIISAPVFGANKLIAKSMDSLYVDGMVYTMHWRGFMSKLLTSWRDSRLLAIGLMIVGAVLLVQPLGQLTKYLGIAAIASSMSAFISSVALVNRYHDAAEYTASEAADALCEMQHSKFRFLPVAFVYSAPGALVTWSTIILATEIFSMIIDTTGLPMRIALVVVFGTLVLCIALRFAIHQIRKLSSRLSRNRRDSSIV